MWVTATFKPACFKRPVYDKPDLVFLAHMTNPKEFLK